MHTQNAVGSGCARVSTGAAVVLTLVLSGAPLRASSISPGTVVPLYSLGTYTDSQGAIYSNADIHPAGVGVFDPFERIHGAGNPAFEQGFNTDSNTFQLDNLTKGGQKFLHALPFSHLVQVTLSGKNYFEFALNLNQQGNSGSYVSLDKVQIFQTSVAEITGYSGAATIGAASDNFYDSQHHALATKVYDEDSGTAGDTTINLNSRLNNGQGIGTADMTLLVPAALFTQHSGYVVLYSSFGDPNAASSQTSNTPGFFAVNGGHEDWAGFVPLPSPLLGGAALFGIFAAARAVRRLRAVFH